MRALPDRPRIAFVGPIAEPGKPSRGGFATANRRTIDLLRTEGVKVIELAYPMAAGSLVRKSAAYGLGFTRIAAQLIRLRNDWDILHITPLLLQFLSAETLLSQLPRRFAKSLFVDLRAGTLISGYHERGDRYRKMLARFIGRATTVAVEGPQYIEFARQWASGDVFYFPNYVIWDARFDRHDRTDPVKSGCIRLVTLGRITPEKGIEIAIDIVSEAVRSGLPVSLDIIGGGSHDYIAYLKNICRGLPVNFTGPIAPSKIADHLDSSHFFIFPTIYPGEGHSNALTEAMASGVIPICSDHGFNGDVVGDAGIILPATATGSDYLATLKNIAHSGRWETLSRSATNRIKARFSHSEILPNLLEAYRNTYKRQDHRRYESRNFS